MTDTVLTRRPVQHVKVRTVVGVNKSDKYEERIIAAITDLRIDFEAQVKKWLLPRAKRGHGLCYSQPRYETEYSPALRETEVYRLSDVCTITGRNHGGDVIVLKS